jgi:hypothetical protein
MRNALNRFAEPRVQIWIWGIWTVVWVVLMPITLVTTLKVSLEWVVFMSLFANCASTATAWVAALGYLRSRAVHEATLDARLDSLGDSHADLHAKLDVIMEQTQ